MGRGWGPSALTPTYPPPNTTPPPRAQKESVPALLAMAQAYALLKQVPKARTQLKRLAKAPWALDEAEDLEKSWLLLADLYCQGGKFDLASELLRRCVQYNKAGGAPPSGGVGTPGGGRAQGARGRRGQRRCGLEPDEKRLDKRGHMHAKQDGNGTGGGSGEGYPAR